METFRAILLGSVCLFLMFWAFGFWAFGMNWSALGLVVLTALWAPWGWSYGKRRLIPAVGFTGVALMLAWLPFVEYDQRVQALSARLDRGPAAYSPRDKLGIYGLNLVMGVSGGLLGFPEVAAETLLLAIPGPKTRVFHSDFPLASPMVRQEVAAMMKRKQPGSKELFWRYDASESFRAGLALNSLVLTGTPNEAGWTFTGVVQVSYPQRYRLVLGSFGGHTFQIEEGLFGMLERAGWLHPYEAAWTWTMQSNDPRLGDLTTPHRGWLEALAVQAAP